MIGILDWKALIRQRRPRRRRRRQRRPITATSPKRGHDTCVAANTTLKYFQRAIAQPCGIPVAGHSILAVRHPHMFIREVKKHSVARTSPWCAIKEVLCTQRNIVEYYHSDNVCLMLTTGKLLFICLSIVGSSVRTEQGFFSFLGNKSHKQEESGVRGGGRRRRSCELTKQLPGNHLNECQAAD